MHSIEFPVINRRFWIPENMAECNRHQYLEMSKLVLFYQMGDISYQEFRVHGFYTLMNLKRSRSEMKIGEEQKMENIFHCSELLDSFFEVDDLGVKHLVQNYIHNPIKDVWYRLQKFYGPKDGFSKISYGELEDAAGELNNFRRFGEVKSLIKLFAIFYRKKGEKYSEIDMEKRIHYFRYLDVRYVYGFYLLFISFFTFLTRDCVIMIDGKELDLRILFKESKEVEEVDPNDPDTLGLRSTSFQLAESGVFGNLEELREADAITVLVRMYDLLIRNMQEKKQMEAQSNQSQHT